jgi:hypothetical protein
MDERPEDYLRNSIVVAQEVINKIVNQGSDQLYENFLTRKIVPFSRDWLSGMIVSLVEKQCLRTDRSSAEVWAEEKEPKACSIDTWARNAVPVKTKVKAPQAEQITVVTQPDARSIVSYSSRRSVMNRGQKAGKSVGKIKETATIEEKIAPMPIHQEKSEINEIEEELRYRKEREMKRKKEDAERVKKMKDEEMEKEKKIQKEAEEIKKKNFTYDHKGKILYVNQVKVEAMPESFINVKYSSQGPPTDEPKKPIKKKPIREFVPIKRTKTAPTQEKEWVKNITSVQNPMIELIKLTPGVTYIEGGRSKCNPDAADSFKTISRKQYNDLYQPKLEKVADQSAFIAEKKSSSASSLDSSKKASESKNELLDIIPDYEDAPVEPETRPKVGMSLSPVRQHGKIMQYAGVVNLDISAGPTEKFNADIINNKNWGLNPPLQEPKVIERIPKKPSVKQLRELYGNIVKKPRDAPFITPGELWEANAKKIRRPRDRPNIERVEKKTRMPPPPYGFTMINALPDINGLGASVSGKTLNKSDIIK